MLSCNPLAQLQPHTVMDLQVCAPEGTAVGHHSLHGGTASPALANQEHHEAVHMSLKPTTTLVMAFDRNSAARHPHVARLGVELECQQQLSLEIS